MKVTLAGTWSPRGEMARLQRLHSQLQQRYTAIVLSVPDTTGAAERKFLQEQPATTMVVTPRRGWGRYLALEEAMKQEADHIHYCDFDRLLHWVETDPVEWQQTLQRIPQHEFLIIGRTERALQSHPQSLAQTERIINDVASSLLAQPVDVGGGSRGFSRVAAQIVLTRTTPGGWGDLQWPILVNQAGLAVSYLAVDGLAWESADRYREQAATADQQARAALTYDHDVTHWARRVQIAQEIIQEGLAARFDEVTSAM
ncbi:MAG TPA: hypothetical protein P5121_25015 [Caldilineaceae bacterium]|nr:hypothetical protein [Caldilineaceae bacterium]